MSFEQYLQSFKIPKKAKDAPVTTPEINPTHTTIPGHGHYAGAYHVPAEKWDEFYSTYYRHVVVGRHPATLTEQQIPDDAEPAEANSSAAVTGDIAAATIGDLVAGSDTSTPAPRVNGPILVDLDFRYDFKAITARQHNAGHLSDIVAKYLDQLKTIFVFNAATQMHIWVFEKPTVFRDESKEDFTKDGIHLVFGLQCDHVVQVLLREMVAPSLQNDVLFDLELLNDFLNPGANKSLAEVLDKGISEGGTNWQVFGSCKPGNMAYQLSQHYVVGFDEDDGQFTDVVPREIDRKKPMSEVMFKRISAQYRYHPVFPMQPAFVPIYMRNKNKAVAEATRKRSGSPSKSSTANKRQRGAAGAAAIDFEDHSSTARDVLYENININAIVDMATLDEALGRLLKAFQQNPNTLHLLDLHAYTMILPEMFYEPGSHDLNFKVRCALHHTSPKMFLTWVKLRSKRSNFDWDISRLYALWCNHETAQIGRAEADRIKKPSIIFWAKQYSLAEFKAAKSQTTAHFVDRLLRHPKEHSDYDMAVLMHHLYGDEFIFIATKKMAVWFMFRDHRWVIDESGAALRLRLSNEIMTMIQNRFQELEGELVDVNTKASEALDAGVAAGDVAAAFAANEVDVVEAEQKVAKARAGISKKIVSAANLLIKLGKTPTKNNFMREAQDVFLDRDFWANHDENPELLGFTNGVFDFTENRLRPGRPTDYITLTTGHPYIELDRDNNPKHEEICAEFEKFMHTIYPEAELNKYMWEHLASAVIGVNMNETLNFYLGGGCNAKSVITNLMTAALGRYADECSVELITGKRGGMNDTSEALMSIQGKRYINMKEPEKGAVVNDGSAKEISGDKYMKARACYTAELKFRIQAIFVCCTNNLPTIQTTDDGIWRRVRVCMHKAKFAWPDQMAQYLREYEYVFLRDPVYVERLLSFAPYFLAMLVRIAVDTRGRVEDCPAVLEASNKYRKRSDFLQEFYDDSIVAAPGDRTARIRKSELWNHFIQWYRETIGVTAGAGANGQKPPIIQSDFFEAMTKRIGAENVRAAGTSNMHWINVKIRYADGENDMDVDV